MDPNACFMRFLNAVSHDDDIVEAFHAMDDLSDWYLNDNFAAKFPGSETKVPANFVHNMVVNLKLACDKLGLSVD